MKLPSGIPESLAASVAQTWPVQCPVFCCCICPSCPYAAGALWGPVVVAFAQAEPWLCWGEWFLHHLPPPMQQEVENFKKVNMISREQFDTLTPEPPVDPNQEVPPGPPRFQQGKRWGMNGWDQICPGSSC